MENLLLPSKIEFLDGDEPNKGSLVVSPCYHGYGTTLGNAIRRVLLSSLPGAAVESFRIKGVQHEFGAVDGVKEDVVEIMLNLKQLVVKVHSEENMVLTLTKKGKGKVVTAADFDKSAEVEIINPDLEIATLTGDKEFEMEIVVGRGRGFVASETKNRDNMHLGTMVIDSIYTPVRDVGYNVENTRVGDITNYEKLTVDIETNGTISPRDAAVQSVKILMDYFGTVLNGMHGESVMAEDLAVRAETAPEEVEEKPAKKKAAKKAKK